MKSIRFKCIAALAALTVLLALSLTGCGDNGDSKDNEDTGLLSLSVTDAPVDGAVSVVIEFTGVEIQSSSGDRLNFDFEPRQINLLALQGGGSELLLDEISLAAGSYNWIRLKVNAESGVLDSYIELTDGIHHLIIPSGDETGLQLVQGFDVPAGGVADFTIDFDLRKSVHDPQELDGDYILRPALRIVDNTKVGSIAGVVDPALTCADGNAVYVFEGHDVIPDDVDGLDADPITTALVELDADTDAYAYKAAFLSAGDYTVAFTCQAEADDPDDDDDQVTFVGAANVVVSAGTITTHNFQ